MQLTIEWAMPDASGRLRRFNLILDKDKVAKLKTYKNDAEMTDWLIMIWAKNHIRANYQTGNADPILLNYEIINQ